MENSILLISGPANIGTYKKRDLEGSLYDPQVFDLVSDVYYVDGVLCVPENAFYVVNGEKLLKYNKVKYPALVTVTLESILEIAGVNLISIPCDYIWSNKNDSRYLVDIVCLSTSFMWSEEMIEKAISWINKNVIYKYLIVGGHYSSIKYKYILTTHKDVDYLIIGDGEEALPRLVKVLLGIEEDDIEAIPNLSYLKNNEIIQTEIRYVNLDELPLVKYKGNHEWISYETIRGCAYNCAFCTWDAGQKKVRYKSVAKIVKELEYYRDNNSVKRVEINDSTFLFPPNRVNDIVKAMKEVGIHWKAHARSDINYSPELVKSLEDSRCDILQIGFESMNDRVLSIMDKKITVDDNRYTNNAFSNSNIDIVASFIVGFPDETVEEFNNTMDYIVKDHIGHFYIFVFEMEDKSLKVWEKRDESGLMLFEDEKDCIHGGMNWEHNGMTSKMAERLREKLLYSVRKNRSLAIYKSWQSQYEWPFIQELNRISNLQIERLLDNLVFAPKDFEETQLRSAVEELVCELKKRGICFK